MSKPEKKLFDELDLETKAAKQAVDAGKELYLAGCVKKLDQDRSTLQAKIIVNDKNFYPELIIKFDRFVANCECNSAYAPFCEHIIALGLAHIHGLAPQTERAANHTPDYIDQLLTRIKTILIPAETTSQIQVGFMLDIHKKNETYSLFLYNKTDQTIIAQPEDQYHQILNSPSLSIVEKNLINFFLKKNYWTFFSPLHYVPVQDGLADILTLFSEVELTDPKNLSTYQKHTQPLKLSFAIDFPEPKLQIQFNLFQDNATIPLADTLFIEGIKNYHYWNGNFFPIETDLYKELLPLLTRTPELSLSGDQIATFLGDLLPLIPENLVNIQSTPTVNRVEIINLQPQTTILLEETPDQLSATLSFTYQDTLIKDSMLSTDQYYYVYKDPNHIYIKKDPFAQLHAENILISNGFVKTDTRYQATEQKALEFLYRIAGELPSTFQLLGQTHLKKFVIHPEPIKLLLSLSVNENKIKLNFQFTHEQTAIDPAALMASLQKGEAFIKQPSTTYYRLPIEDYQSVKNILSKMPLLNNSLQNIEFDAIYVGLLVLNFKNIITYSQVDAAYFGGVDHTQIPDEPLPELAINTTLRIYQREGYSWLIQLYRRRWNGILADDMGLGKTLQTLALLLNVHRASALPSLLVLPTSLIFNWERECAKFTPGLTTLKYYGPDRNELLPTLNQYHLVFTSYGTVRRDIDILKNISFNYIILDEAQNIKNHLSQTAQTVKQLRADHKLALTGTPLENRLSELWSIFDFLTPGFLGSNESFMKQYEQFSTENASTAINELKTQITPFILRRTKQNVALDLPEKFEEDYICQMDSAFESAYKQLRNQLSKSLWDNIEKDGINKHRLDIFTVMLRLRQFLCHPKLLKNIPTGNLNTSPKFEAFKTMIDEIVHEDHKVLVFSQFTEMLQLMRHWITSQNYPYAYLDGATRDRSKVVDTFNNDPECKIFLISLKAGGTGLNLTSADYVIHYDPWWNPAVQSQATDRAYRIGQTKNVFAYKFLTRDSLEEKIQSLQIQKAELYQAILAGQELSTGKINESDLKFLFS